MSLKQQVSIALEEYRLKLPERSKKVVLSRINDVVRIGFSVWAARQLEIRLN